MGPWGPWQSGVQGALTQNRQGSHKLHAVFVELEVDGSGMQDGAHEAPFSCAEPCEEMGKLRQGTLKVKMGFPNP